MPVATSIKTHNDVTDALMLKLNAPLVEFDAEGRVALGYNETPKVRKPSSQAVALSRESLVDIGDAYLRTVGPPEVKAALSGLGHPQRAALMLNRGRLARFFPLLVPGNRHVTLSTAAGDYPQLLADSLNKAVLSHYATARRSWRAWAKRGTAKDFKQAERVRLDEVPMLSEAIDGAEIEFAHLPEHPSETFTLASYARGLKLTRETLINDDANALGAITQNMAAAAHRLEDYVAYRVLTANEDMADGEPLFSTGHNNITTGALSAESVSAAMAAIAEQKNDVGDILDLQAGRLIVPSALKMQGETILDSVAGAQRGAGESTVNVVSSAWLQADSATQFYLATDPDQLAAVEVCFLEGQDGPRVDQAAHFDTDTVRFRVRHDIAAKAIDYRGIVRSTGTD